jgi:hypothetical protein
LPLYDKAAMDIGTVVLHMAESDFHGRPDREIEQYANDCLVVPDHLKKAWTSFGQFRAWRNQCHPALSPRKFRWSLMPINTAGPSTQSP